MQLHSKYKLGIKHTKLYNTKGVKFPNPISLSFPIKMGKIMTLFSYNI